MRDIDIESVAKAIEADAGEPLTDLRQALNEATNHNLRSTISFLISEIAFAGLRPLGQVLAQFMMVWQR